MISIRVPEICQISGTRMLITIESTIVLRRKFLYTYSGLSINCMVIWEHKQP
jgi:hypothetical protein